jgi:hypothetical protein
LSCCSVHRFRCILRLARWRGRTHITSKVEVHENHPGG